MLVVIPVDSTTSEFQAKFVILVTQYIQHNIAEMQGLDLSSIL